jgi:endo-1,4-beta-xylanase
MIRISIERYSMKIFIHFFNVNCKKRVLQIIYMILSLITFETAYTQIQTDVPALKDVFAKDFYIGCLLSYRAIGFSTDPQIGQSTVAYPEGGYLIKYHMNSMGPGNNMKPIYTVDLSGSAATYAAASMQAEKDSINIHPIIRFNADLKAQLDWAARQGFKFRGHTLVWHSQTPGLGFFCTGYSSTNTRVSKDTMTMRLENYVKEVVRLIHEGWPGLLLAMDVVNEAVNGDGTNRSAGNDWYATFGDNSYIMKAFEFTRKYTQLYGETQMKLYYNDYSTDVAAKANGIVRVCGPIFRAGFLDGIGMQDHDQVYAPTVDQWIASYKKFDTICTEMAVTELDVKMTGTTKTDTMLQARQFGALMKCFIERSARSGRGKIVNVTKDGLYDSSTFVINSSIFDSRFRCKPSFFAVVNVGLDYNKLDSLVRYTDSFKENDYTSASWLYFQSLLSAAKVSRDKNYSASVSATDGLAQGITTLEKGLASLVRKDANIAFYLASKNSINFGGVAIGSVKNDSVKITNLGTDTLRISTVLSTNSQYSISVASDKIAPSEEIYLMISFTPPDTTTQSGYIILTHNAANIFDSIAVSGKGIPANGILDKEQLPKEFALGQNYPNPFNPTTQIAYSIAQSGHVSLKVYDLLGKEVAILFDGMRQPGRYIAIFNGARLASGVYFYRLQSGKFVETKKLILMK